MISCHAYRDRPKEYHQRKDTPTMLLWSVLTNTLEEKRKQLVSYIIRFLTRRKGEQPKPLPPVMNPRKRGNQMSNRNCALALILAHSSWITGCQMPLISVNGLYCFLAQSLNSATSLSVKSLNSFIVLSKE
jgi:hypothetical protein